MYYIVQDKQGRKLFESGSRKDAFHYFNAHTRSNLVQKYTKKGGLTAGIEQPGVPRTIKRDGTDLVKAYVGFFTKAQAGKIVRGFKKAGHLSASRKFKNGYQVYVHVR